MHTTYIVPTVLALVLASGCASVATRKQQEELDSVKKQLSELTGRLQAVEGRITPKTAPVAPTQAQAAAPTPAKTVGVAPHPAEGAGMDVPPVPALSDPEPGFVNDAAVQEFRRAMVFYEAGRYEEANLGFSGFLEKYPDHPFAGSAQFYVGECHFQRKEYPQAYEEFHRVLTTYDRSHHVAATLRDLAAVEDQLQKKDEAARHRHQLTSLFPQSPAAQLLAQAAKKAPAPSAPAEDISVEPRKETHQATEPGTGAKPQERPQENAARLDEPPPPTAP